ncbi:unnamed protein product [Musa acuminata subsp. malaccensis]|uniref:(wild Malaysian banana) hypothetical protein n=1 Tax=Musa acuminata subsp. malaccensis TaxID=214687 RepID=A0A804JJ39_MUSAM|nr:PREDICTED: DELLA protein GAI-like [Musa acuminata subsp. malaccensis]CAG1846983.1 unnamed protein product [Musa acuminata subsp. malaccensis]
MMINNRCGSFGSLKSDNASSSKQGLPSPTTSAEESNVLTASMTEEKDQSTLKGLKLDADIDVEVQSPDRALLESLFADQVDFGADFMISSPRRDLMACSPRRDFMACSPRRDFMACSPMRDCTRISSPKRDYMVSSPKREYMVSSPKRENMVSSPKRVGLSPTHSHHNSFTYVRGMHGSPGLIQPSYYSSNLCKGKSQSPLHKVCNSSSSLYASCSSSTELLHGESLALPAVDAFYWDYSRDGYEVCAMGAEFSSEALAAPPMASLPSLLDCFVMESRYGNSANDMMAAGVQFSGEDDRYQQVGGGGAVQHQEHGFLCAVGPNATSSTTTATNTTKVEASYHGLVGGSSAVVPTELEQEQDSGLQLVHLLLACAEATSKDDLVAARRYLHNLNHVVSPFGDSMQRVASCFTDALSARLSPSTSSSRKYARFPPPAPDVLKIYQIIYQACPYIKFAHFTANQAIFEAFESEDCVHVIDLDILQGYQWPAFLQALAARPGGAPALRITGVGHPADSVRETGRHLAELAHSLRVPFEFHAATVERLEDLRPSMLHRRVGEALAVNSVNRLHRVPGAHLGPLLAMIRDQAPKIFTLVEQEASHNGPYFLGRFLEALHYYSAIFDSLDATFPSDSAARAKVEQFLLAPEIRNIVACEGSERVARHERLERWRRVMEGRGFEGVALSANAVNQSKILLGLYPCDGYRLTEDKGCLLLGWQDRPIIAASAWRC